MGKVKNYNQKKIYFYYYLKCNKNENLVQLNF